MSGLEAAVQQRCEVNNIRASLNLHLTPTFHTWTDHKLYYPAPTPPLNQLEGDQLGESHWHCAFLASGSNDSARFLLNSGLLLLSLTPQAKGAKVKGRGPHLERRVLFSPRLHWAEGQWALCAHESQGQSVKREGNEKKIHNNIDLKLPLFPALLSCSGDV